jgi:hypothetical protein
MTRPLRPKQPPDNEPFRLQPEWLLYRAVYDGQHIDVRVIHVKSKTKRRLMLYTGGRVTRASRYGGGWHETRSEALAEFIEYLRLLASPARAKRGGLGREVLLALIAEGEAALEEVRLEALRRGLKPKGATRIEFMD